jgi:hypothetical protein
MRGRPTLYKAENAELARKFCVLGATNEDLARCFEVSRSRIDQWIDTIPEFADSIRQGRDLADAAVPDLAARLDAAGESMRHAGD